MAPVTPADFFYPVQSIVPGVRGKILGACLRTSEPLTMRALARLAGVSADQAAQVNDELDVLGLLHAPMRASSRACPCPRW